MDAQIKTLTSAITTSIALQAVTLAAIIGMTWYSHKELRQYVAEIGAGRQQAVPAEVEDWESYVREYNAFLGEGDEEVVLVEFSDFQCPFCKRFTESVRGELLAEYGDEIRFVFKHLPLEQIHPQARMMAVAAQCAAREGRFWDIHEFLFGQTDTLDVDGVLGVGDTLGLSPGYSECVVNEETLPEVEQDLADAQALGVQGTPTFMINGQFLVGTQTIDAFRSLIGEVAAKND